MIQTSFDPTSPAIITPDMIAPQVKDIPDTVIVTFQPRTFRALMAAYRPTAVSSIHIEEDADQDLTATLHTLNHNGHRIGAYLSPAGAPITVATMEQAIALGVRRFVVFGSCGVLRHDLPEQGIIVPTKAYRDEGTSYHYAPASDYIDVTTAERLAAILSDLEVPHITGPVWTTDAFFRETQSNAEARRAEGCLAVEMEVSALAALAQFRQVEVYHFLFGADEVGEQWNPRILGSLPSEPRLALVRIALEVATRLDAETRSPTETE